MKLRNGNATNFVKKINKGKKRVRKSIRRIPFGMYYDYRSQKNERNLCLYTAISEICDFYDIKIGNCKNINSVKWIKHIISRNNRRKLHEQGDTLDAINFLKFWENRGNDIAILFVDEERNFKEGFVSEYYKYEPDKFDVFVIEWQDSIHSCLLHFSSIMDDDEIDSISEKYLTEDNAFLTWL